MICNGAPVIPPTVANYIEFYQRWYRLNYDIYRIWWGPALDIYLGAISEYNNSSKSD